MKTQTPTEKAQHTPGLFRAFPTPAQDGDSVGIWKDRSGNNNAATQPTSSKQPVREPAMKRSPLPERLAIDPLETGARWSIETPEHEAVCLVQQQIDDRLYIKRDALTTEIVKRWNAHAALIEACKAALRELDRLTVNDPLKAQLRAAIAQAEGDQS